MNRPIIMNHLSAEKVRDMCVRFGLCDSCSNAEYNRLLNRFDKYGEYNGLTDTLIDLCMLLCRYTHHRDETDAEQVKGMIVMVLNHALVWSYAK